MKILLALLLAAVTSSAAPSPDDVRLVWTAPANAPVAAITNYTVWVGTNSGSYLTNFNVAVTNAPSVTNLFKLVMFYPGTNYVCVQVRQGDGTNGMFSDKSQEIIVRRVGPALLFILESAVDINGPWTPGTEPVAEVVVAAVGPQKFYRTRIDVRQ